VALLHACQSIDGIDVFSTLEGLPTVEETSAWLADFDPQRMLVAEVDARMIGCVRTTWWEEENGTWLFLHHGRVLPEWRGNGLGTAFILWAEHYLQEQARSYPTKGKGTFGANASSTETSATELLLNEGYTVYHTLAQMEFTSFSHLQRLPLPEGFEIRAALPEDYRTIWEAGRRHWAGLTKASSVPDEKDYQEFLRLITPDPALLVVIWHDEQPVAITQGRIVQETGIVDDLVVSPAYKRRGLAQIMLTECLLVMKERGVKRIRLHTDATNRHGARSLYEKLGFQTIKLFPRYRKPMGI
jgi:ribosomal protein S18 acetylase RimI-like enzyme